MRRILSFVALAFMVVGGMTGCNESLTGPDAVKPQFDETQPGLGEPCDPATYSGPYVCAPGPNGRTFVQLG
jgi:hypothetical protein